MKIVAMAQREERTMTAMAQEGVDDEDEEVEKVSWPGSLARAPAQFFPVHEEPVKVMCT